MTRRMAWIALLLAALAGPARGPEPSASAEPAAETLGLRPLLGARARALTTGHGGHGARDPLVWAPELDTRSVALALGWRTLLFSAREPRGACDAELPGGVRWRWRSAMADAARRLRACARRRGVAKDGALRSPAPKRARACGSRQVPRSGSGSRAPQVWDRRRSASARALARDRRRRPRRRCGLWLARAAAPAASADRCRRSAIAASASSTPGSEVRDHPARGGFRSGGGRSARWRLAASVESHPVLGGPCAWRSAGARRRGEVRAP